MIKKNNAAINFTIVSQNIPPVDKVSMWLDCVKIWNITSVHFGGKKVIFIVQCFSCFISV